MTKASSQWIGLMSGTSLDGLDIVCVEFSQEGPLSYNIRAAETIDYSEEWKYKLSVADEIDGRRLAQLHVDLGVLHGQHVHHFITKHALNPIGIASHGHTIFHQPDTSLTLQIGSAPHIAAIAKKPVVADFRTGDVARGGQGAPLVPIGDQLLFSQYDYCLNLGGISNVSFQNGNHRIAYDLSICNMVLNYLAMQQGQAFDRGGEMAKAGNVISELLEEWNALPYYKQAPPKSLGREFFTSAILPILQKFDHTIEDLMATAVEHIAIQTSQPFQQSHTSVLATGGGALNNYLIERLQYYSKSHIAVPDELTVQFKEALIFALLGYLRWNQHPTALSSVTGAHEDAITGAIWL